MLALTPLKHHHVILVTRPHDTAFNDAVRTHGTTVQRRTPLQLKFPPLACSKTKLRSNAITLTHTHNELSVDFVDV